ncbi:Elongation factor Ts [Cardiobacterium hominis]|uniref:Elongation factor Ts n=1 Tax=Cardiobacterium hominis (strain ATCC 15826 / DSM 8339 / NCTC 10426 / 6573) TaxID=638300 RepID=C8NAT0_CARH6|nr:translation elongation factor Ts [Cardiobacterium hominis]EEV88301.1 translation elongation factor Ts [Cardiobacterium hominis ATCC 15826]VEG78063.1 Elongation factor Ts [Cardiobacterium hominis]
MSISAQLVKELRERTGAGMMECKKALLETNGDIEAAVEYMRKTGLAKADKKAGRVAAEGALVVSISDDAKEATILEANCETDFVAMGDEFRGFANRLAEVARTQKLADIDALNAAEVAPGVTADERRRELVAKIGENMTIRRFVTLTAGSGVIGHYLHGQKIGVLVEITTGDVELAKDIAMHIAASNPISLDAASLPQDFLDKENEIHRAKAEQSGKPANIIEKMVEGAMKMVEGAMKKLFGEVTLKGQSFVKNPDITVEQLLKEKGADVVQFTRFELGEGIEKEESDFVAEVMAQAKGV